MPVFCFDDRLLARAPRAPARGPSSCSSASPTSTRELRERGSGLVIRHGPPERELAALAREIGAERDPRDPGREPVRAPPRRARPAGAAPTRASSCARTTGLNAVDVARDRDRAGQAVHGLLPLSPQLARGRRAATVLEAPRELPPLPVAARQGPAPVAGRARARAGGQRARRPGARREARRALDALPRRPGRASTPTTTTRSARDRHLAPLALPALRLPLAAGRSRSGCRAARAPEAFRRQLCWRDFYHHVLHHFPRNARSEFQERYRGTIKWSYARAAVRGLVRGPHRLSRSSTPGCASSGARAGCTTAPGSSSARS